MNALILAAGYATRLRPLTEKVSKMLLPVGGRPMVEYVVDAIAEVPEVEEIHLVTNARFAADFRAWAEGPTRLPVAVHDDGTTSNEDRLGAIGDIRLVLEGSDLGADDAIVIAGDNLFDFSLADEVALQREKEEASVVALYDVGDLELVRKYSAVELDEDDRIVSFVEKPDDPQSTLIATAAYVFHRRHLGRVGDFLAEGNPPDPVGNFLAWLAPRAAVYGFRFSGEWLDIGDPGQLLEADNLLRRRRGLPARAEYALD